MIEHNVGWPTVNQRTSVEIFDAANSQRFLIWHSSGAGELRFRARLVRCRSWLRAIEMAVVTVALDRDPTGFANGVLQCRDALLLRRGRSRHVEDLFFHDRAMQIVDAVTEGDLRER